MGEIVVTKDELINLFVREDIKDTQEGWLYKDEIYVNIIAIHDQDPKYVYNVTNAQYYKIAPINPI
jgi:hypothetical protein